MKKPPPPLQVVGSEPKPGTGRAYGADVPKHADGIRQWLADKPGPGAPRIIHDNRTPPPRPPAGLDSLSGVRALIPTDSGRPQADPSVRTALLVLGAVLVTMLLFGGSR